MTQFLDICHDSNLLQKQRYLQDAEEQKEVLHLCAEHNTGMKQRALSAHYSAKDMNASSILRHREFLDLKNQLNLLCNQREQLSSTLTQLNSVLSTEFVPQSMEHIMYLQNRLDEQKLRYKEAQSISEIYKNMKGKLLEDSIWYTSTLEQADDTSCAFSDDFARAREIHNTASIEVEIQTENLAIERQELTKCQLSNKLKLEEEKNKVRNALKREDDKYDPKKARASFDLFQLSAVQVKPPVIKPLFEKLVSEHYAFKNMPDFVERAKMTEFDLLQNKAAAEQRLSDIENEVSAVKEEIRQTAYENENQVITGKGIKEELQLEYDAIMRKQQLSRQAFELMNRRFEQISVFFVEYDSNLHIIELVPETLEKYGIVLSQHDEISFSAFCLKMEAKIACLKELLNSEEHSAAPSEDRFVTAPEDLFDDFHAAIGRSKTAGPDRLRCRLYTGDDELRIFTDLPQDIYDGELPRNRKVQFDPDSTDKLVKTEGVYRSALSDGLRRTRGFRIDREAIKQESEEYAEYVKQAKLREAGYFE